MRAGRRQARRDTLRNRPSHAEELKMLPRLAACTLGLVLVSQTGFASPAVPRAGTLTPEMVVSRRDVSEVAIGRDGRLVAYVLSRPRAAEDKPGGAFQEIWVVPAAGGAARRYTPEKQRAWAPAFSPDGTQLAFLSNRPKPGNDSASETTDLFAL